MIPLKFYRDDEYVYYNNPNGITKKMSIADFEALFSEGGVSSDIPTYDSSDSGKILTVNSGGTGLEWSEKGGVTSYPYVVDDVNQTEYFDITYQQALSHFNNGELFFLYGTQDTLDQNEFIYPVSLVLDGTNNAVMRCLNSAISAGHLEYYDLVANELTNWKFQLP